MNITKEQVILWLDNIATRLHDQKEYLTELDSAIGDADHGINMDRGFKHVAEQLPTIAQNDIGSIFKTVGMTLMSKIGGASGPLYGTFFMRGGMALAAKEELKAEDLLKFFRAGIEGIIQRGRPSLNDKTMYDVWLPAVDAFQDAIESGQSISEALKTMEIVAKKAMEGTIPLLAKKGRASYLGERSIGHQDPGSTSTYFMIQILSDIVA